MKNKQNASIRTLIRQELASKAEVKRYVFDQGATLSNTAGAMFNLSQFIIQGDDYNQRTGDSIDTRRVDVSINATLPSLGVAATLRFILFSDSMSNGVAPTSAELLNTVGIVSPINPVAMTNNRFTTLMDQAFPMVAGGADQIVHFQRHIKFRKRIAYFGSAAVAASIGRNNLFMFVLGDNGTVNAPSYIFDVTMCYTDV